MFKNILRTFEAEILKIFENIQPQPKNETFLKKIRGQCRRIQPYEELRFKIHKSRTGLDLSVR